MSRSSDPIEPGRDDGQSERAVEGATTRGQQSADVELLRAHLAEAERVASVLSDAFERIADGVIVLDHGWCFEYVNSRAETLLRKDRQELIGHNIWEVMPEAVGTVFYQQFHRAVRNQESVSFEEYYPPNDMWASVHVQPSFKGLTIYLSDITSEKQTEMALGRSEGQLRAVIDNSPAVIYMKDLEGHFIRVNDEFLRRFGYTREQLSGMTDYDLLPPDIADQVRDNDRLVLESGKPMQFDEEVRLPDGRTVLYLTMKFPLKDTSGRTYGTAGISTDMNDRILQERALAESEQRFRKIFEEGPLGIALLDRSLTYLQVNDRFAEMLGYPKQEVIGKSLVSLTHKDDIERTIALPQQLLRGEVPYYRVEKRYVRRDGGAFLASIHGTLIKDDEGNPLFILVLAEDINQRKAAEAALRDKDMAIRKAYTDVIAAVTGGKLVLMTQEEIEDTLGEPVSDGWHVDVYAELSDVRRALKRALFLQGMDSDTVDSYVLAACEGFTNAIKHAGGGEVRVHRKDDTLQVVITDHGPGIDFQHLPKATLVAGFSTVQSLGMGFTIMLEVCDRLLLSTQHGLTVVVLEAANVPVVQPVPTGTRSASAPD